MKVALVHSGNAQDVSPDNQDTWVQMSEISELLKQLGYETVPIPFHDSLANLETALRHHNPDWVFNLVETAGGSDEMLYLAASVFRFLGLPYTGCSDVTLAMLSSKLRQKTFLRMAQLPTPDWLNPADPLISAIPSKKQWIVKSDSEHASLGMGSENVVSDSHQARALLVEKQRVWGGQWFAEEYIEGREFNLSILDDGVGGPVVLPPAEICFQNFPPGKPRIVDYQAKWNAESPEYHGTVRRFQFEEEDTQLLEELKSLCCACWETFFLRGAARVDFRIDAAGKPWILEMNANPCLASDAGFMAASRQAGLTPLDVITNLIPRPKEKRV